MAATLDHLIWAAPELEAAVADLAARTGVRAGRGGQHPDLGTHNALAGLGRRRYLEVIAPDPALPAGAFARKIAALPAPTLLMWAARVPSAAAVAARAREEGYEARVVEGHRPRPDGTVFHWTSVFVGGHGAGTLVPFFIEWAGPTHPADDAPNGLALHALHAETPEPEALRAVLEALEVRLAVRRGPAARLVAALDTPRGPITLEGP